MAYPGGAPVTIVGVGLARPAGSGGGAGGNTTPASAALPVTQAVSGTTPITGTFTATGQSAVFTAIPGHAIWVKLSGTFVATVAVQRCNDGTAATRQNITVGGTNYAVFTTPVQEAVSAEDDGSVAYLLNCSAYTSGTVIYQIGHK